jgi:hypothetical protein
MTLLCDAMDNSDSTDRRPGEYVLFALVFLGFLMAAGGVTLSSPGGTFTGVAVILPALAGFAFRRAPED